jgi:hypothetical protein
VSRVLPSTAWQVVFYLMVRLNQLCKRQRERKDLIHETRLKLAAVLQAMRESSSRAMTLLGQLQNENEVCLAVGNVICSKIQHAVIVCDPDSAAVAASVTAIDDAVVAVSNSSSVSLDVLREVQAFTEVSSKLTRTQKTTNTALDGMCEAHQHAFDIHSNAVDAIENGFGIMPEPDIICVSCGRGAELLSAARTGMCLECATQNRDESGWTRCVGTD